MATLKERKELIESLRIPKSSLKIKDNKVAGNPTSSPYSRNWRYKPAAPTDLIKKQWEETGGWGFGKESNGQGFFTPLPLVQGQTDKKVAHHLEDHFQDKPIEAILQDIITNEVPLPPEDLERILGPDYEEIINQFKRQQEQKNSLKIG